MRTERLETVRILAWPLFATLVLLYGCQTTVDSSRQTVGRPPAGKPAVGTIVVGPTDAPAGAETVHTFVDARPAALIDGRPLVWGELRPILNDLAGAEATQEVILDRKLDEELHRAGIVIGEDAIGAEGHLLVEGLHQDPDTALRLLEDLRDQRRLGKRRYAALLNRNAALRALVRDKVVISEHAIETMHDVLHGPKRTARIVVVRDLSTAHAALSRISAGETFAEVAALMSIDTSASRGGLLEPISRLDRAYPEALRQAIWRLNVGQISDPVLIDDRFAVIMLVSMTKGDNVTIDEDRTNLVRQVRLQQERVLMEQLARRMIGETAVTIFDDELHDAWTRSRRSDGASAGPPIPAHRNSELQDQRRIGTAQP